MSVSKYESKVCSIPCDAHTVYSVLSRLDSLERVRDLIPQDKVRELEIMPDCIRMKVDGLGQKICIRIVDRKEDDTIKFGIENIPMDMNFWIQLKQVAPCDTRVRLTLHADMPMMFRMMLGSKIQKGLDDGAQMLTQFPYELWSRSSEV
jgi:hypothetical protein